MTFLSYGNSTPYHKHRPPFFFFLHCSRFSCVLFRSVTSDLIRKRGKLKGALLMKHTKPHFRKTVGSNGGWCARCSTQRECGCKLQTPYAVEQSCLSMQLQRNLNPHSWWNSSESTCNKTRSERKYHEASNPSKTGAAAQLVVISSSIPSGSNHALSFSSWVLMSLKPIR